jgi:membrane protease subunit HflK
MPWNNQGGGGWQGGGRGPWGQGPSGGGGGGPQPPNLEDLLRRGQARFRRMAPGGRWGGRGVALAVLVLLVLWGFTGVYRVQTDEQGVVLRFGQYVRTTPPGLHIAFPAPIETVLTPKVTREQQVEVGFRSGGDFGRPTASREVLEEALMLTGDENIVDINFAVVWRIKDARDFLFNIQQPAATVKAVAESVMREIVGLSKIDDVLTEGRAQVEVDALDLIQATLDSYGAGIEIVRVKLQKADPPAAVIDAFRDVQRARADQERLRNEAQAYANDIIPRARGEAEQNRLQAEGYRERVVAEARGESARYLSVLEEYRQAPDVTRRRMFLEVMETIYRNADKVILDTEGGSVVPYLPLPELQKRATQQQQQQRPATGGTQQ